MEELIVLYEKKKSCMARLLFFRAGQRREIFNQLIEVGRVSRTLLILDAKS